jgi:putative phage-type endonuclease
MDKVRDIKWYRNRVKTLRAQEQPQQRSPEWFAARNTRVTASEVASCLLNIEPVCKPYVEDFNIQGFKYDGKSCSHYDTRDEYIIKKCKAFFGENVFKDSVFTLWGKKYEEIATRLYRQYYKTEVIEFGLLPHPRLKWLGASPDGITPDGIMLEIKCPYKRKINGIVPFHYYQQMQIQLHVTDLDICHFLECEIKEIETEKEFLELKLEEFNPNQFQQKGILINKIDEPNNSETKYIYPPDDLLTEESFITWRDETISNLNVKAKPIYYFIHKWGVINVKRNRQWFLNVKDDIKKTWMFFRKLQDNPEDFEKYKQSIYLIKNKEFIDLYNSTQCIISDKDSTFIYETSDNSDSSICSQESSKNLISIENDKNETTCLID